MFQEQGLFVGFDGLQKKGQDFLLQTVAIIAGTYYKRDGDQAALRAKLLRPILQQDEKISEHIKARRSVPDVNTKTGEEQGTELGEEITEDK